MSLPHLGLAGHAMLRQNQDLPEISHVRPEMRNGGRDESSTECEDQPTCQAAQRTRLVSTYSSVFERIMFPCWS